MVSDAVKYGSSSPKAMLITTAGFVATVGITAVLLPEEASIAATLLIGTAVSVPIGMGINWIKDKYLRLF